MFDNYISKYFSLLNLENSDNDVNLSDISGSREIPKAIKKFISSEINRIVVGNIDNIRNQSLFDQTNSDLLKLLNRLESEMKNSIRMSSYEYHQFIKSILEIRFNYICRPITTLSELIFKNEKEQSLVDIQQIMEYFDEYNYFLEGVSDWYENNLDKSFLTKDEFKDLMKEIDEDYVYNIELEDFLKLIKNLYKVFSFDGLIEEEIEDLPIEALIIFFSEKGITPILNLLETEYENDVLTLSYPTIEELISNLLDSKSEVDEVSEEAIDSDISDFEDETETVDDFEELEYFGEDELEDVEETDIESLEELTSTEINNSSEIDDFEELEYFGEDELEDVEETDIESLEELTSTEIDDSSETEDFEELEYFGEDELEDVEETDIDNLEELTSTEIDDSSETEDFEKLEYFGEDEIEDVEETDIDSLLELTSTEIDDSSETEDFEELEYFGEEELEDDDTLDLDDFLLDDEELNENNKSE